MPEKQILEESTQTKELTPSERYFKTIEEALQRKSVQSVVEEIDEYPNLLAKTKGAKSISKLNVKHRENFTSISETFMEDYEKEYGKMPEYEKVMYMESTFFIRGEGHSICLMMTPAIPCADDYDSNLPFEQRTELITTQAHRAVREFHNEFGASSLYNLKFYTRESFFEKHYLMIPYTLLKLKDKPCVITFKTRLQYSFP
jgi:hypothetical protein